MNIITQKANEFYVNYRRNDNKKVINLWQWLMPQDNIILEQFFFELRILWEEEFRNNSDARAQFEKEFMDNIYQLIEYQKIEKAGHLRIIELGQKVRVAFRKGFRGESEHLSAEQSIVHGRMMGENKSFKQRLIDTINDKDFTENQQKRVAELLNDFAIEKKKDERSILQKLRNHDD